MSLFLEQLATAGPQWKPLDAPRKGARPRSPEACAEVLTQFSVESSARYQPVGKTTFCNIFAWDWSRAMGAELPHWTDSDHEACTAGIPGATETTANQLHDLLLSKPGRWGWMENSEKAVAVLAADGHPAVVLWRNPDGPGHIAVVEPLPITPGFRVAQAGAVCGRQFSLRSVFSGNKQLRFFAHE